MTKGLQQGWVIHLDYQAWWLLHIPPFHSIIGEAFSNSGRLTVGDYDECGFLVLLCVPVFLVTLRYVSVQHDWYFPKKKQIPKCMACALKVVIKVPCWERGGRIPFTTLVLLICVAIAYLGYWLGMVRWINVDRAGALHYSLKLY